MPRDGTHARSAHDLVEFRLVGIKLRAVVFWMPKMQNVGGKPSVLAAHAGVKQTYDKIGVFQSPTDVGGIEPIDAIEIGAGDGEIASLRALPCIAL